MKRTAIERLLPRVFERSAGAGTPLSALLEAMAGAQQPVEEVLRRLPSYFSPHGAPDAFVPMLAIWVDFDWLWQVEGRSSIGRPVETAADVRQLSCGIGRLRDLILAASELSRWRGTSRGLCRFLALATGESGFEVVERVPGPDGRPLPYHVRVHAPGAERHRTLIERIINEEKPAHVTFELSFEGPKT
ncbi:MAG: phage tail protein [Acidobacteriota bacterium]